MLNLNSKKVFPRVTVSAQEWLFQTHTAMRRARTAIPIPPKIFKELEKAGFIKGTNTSAQITDDGYVALSHYRGLAEKRKEKGKQ